MCGGQFLTVMGEVKVKLVEPDALPNGLYFERLNATTTVQMDAVATAGTTLDELTAFFHDAVMKEGGATDCCSRKKITVLEVQHKGRTLAPDAPVTLKEMGMESGDFIRIKFKFALAVGLSILCIDLC